MVHAVDKGMFDLVERTLPTGSSSPSSSSSTGDFGNLFESAAAASPETSSTAASSVASTTASTTPGGKTTLGQPDVQAWLESYYTEMAAANPLGNYTGAATMSYESGQGSGSNFGANSVFGPDAIFAQALQNQAGNAFAQMTGGSGASLTSQLPGVPTSQAQGEFDRRLALENAQRLASGQPIDTTAYWSDPGPMTFDGVTYTSKDLGYAGPGQSAGAEPIYISTANQVGPNTYNVPGYNGTVSGIQPGRYYTLAQLEKAGLAAGQADAQFHPGSWSEVESA